MHEFERGGKGRAERDGGQVAAKPEKRRKPERIWDGRGDALEDQRLTIAAGRLADDLRLKETHFRLMAHVGRQNGTRGWLRVSQSELAERWAVHRMTVNKAVGQLVEWGYLKKRTQQDAGESFCLYKVTLDDEAELPPEARRRGDGDGGECSPTTAPHRGGECSPTTAPVKSYDCTRAVRETAPPTIYPRAHRQTPASAEVITPSRPPRSARRGESGKPVDEHGDKHGTAPGIATRGWAARWDQAARAAVLDLIGGPRAHVAEVLLMPLVGTLQPPAGVHAASYVRDVAEQLAHWPAPVLAEVAIAMRARQVRDMMPAATLRQLAAVVAKRMSAASETAARTAAAPRVDADAWLADLMRADASRPDVALARQLVARIGQAAACSWFAGLAVERDGRRLVVTLPQKFCARFVAQHYAEDLHRAAVALWPEVERVAVEHAPQARAA